MVLSRLRDLIAPKSATAKAPSEALSTALLLLELAAADFESDDVELERVGSLLCERYGLDSAALDQLLREARSRARQSVSLHEYVQTLNNALDADGKRRLIAMLWQVALADGRIDKYEEHLLRRLVDLLFIPMADYIQAREAAIAQAGANAGANANG